MAPAALLLAVLLAAPPDQSAPITASGEPDAAPVELPGTRELEHLCAALEPAERLRPKGDAVARAEAEDAHEERRELVTVARYRAVLPAAKLRFAQYGRAARSLALSDGVLSLPGGARIYPTTDAGLPVEVDAEVARRILAEQKAGRLALEVVFDLADETTCSRGKPRTLPVEPVTWTWLADGTPLARGGAGADRPVVTAERGARPAVSVGEPLQGPAGTGEELRRHVPALQQCYGEALRRAPGLDGVLVVELAPGRPVPYVAGDSVGDAGLSECVKRTLAGVRSADGLAAIPIRFELAPPAP